jgi:hypothetical protein
VGVTLPDFPKLDSALSESFHINLNFSGSVVLEKKNLKEFSYKDTCQMIFTVVAPSISSGELIQ